MSDVPTSITARVKNVEDCIASVRARLRNLENTLDSNPREALSALMELSAQLQSIRSKVDEIRSLVRYS